MTIVQPDVKAFREATKDVHKKVSEKWEAGLYEKIQAVKLPSARRAGDSAIG